MNIIKKYIDYLNDNPKHLWFKRKLYGWGWAPATWQGFVITLVYIASIFAVYFLENKYFTDGNLLLFIAPVAFFTLIFIWIAFKTGEKPRWQWGRDED